MLRRQDSIKCNAHPKTTHPHLTIQYNMLQFKCHAPHNLNIQFQFQLMRLIWNAKVSLVNLVAKGGRGLEEGWTRTLVQVRISASTYSHSSYICYFLCPTPVRLLVRVLELKHTQLVYAISRESGSIPFYYGFPNHGLKNHIQGDQ